MRELEGLVKRCDTGRAFLDEYRKYPLMSEQRKILFKQLWEHSIKCDQCVHVLAFIFTSILQSVDEMEEE